MPRIVDVLVAAFALAILVLPMLAIAALVRLTSTGPSLFWSDRIGRYNKVFSMPKFRSMRVGTPALPSHLMSDPASRLTPIGAFLRRSSLDELPQLWCVLTGDMALVGPRPALFNQQDLMAMRTAMGVDQVRPGVTGWAQINGRDSLSIPQKVEYDVAYVRSRSFVLDVRILWLTVSKVSRGAGVSH
jgi:O-antigen biosynthesis protein WbqP